MDISFRRTVVSAVRFISVVGMAVIAAWYLLSGFTSARAGSVSPWLGNLPILLTAMSALGVVWNAARVQSARLGSPDSMRLLPLGLGVVKAVEWTGYHLGRPQLEIHVAVEAEDGEKFDTVVKHAASIADVSSIAPGAVLPLRLLPGSHKRVVLDRAATLDEIQSLHDAINVRSGITTDRALDIAARGVQAQALVADLRPTGEIVRGNPRVAITLIVNRQAGIFEVVAEKVVPLSLLDAVQVGRIITVAYLPGEESDVTLLLSGMR